MKVFAKNSDFFYFSLKNQGRQNYIFPSKFQTYLNYSKPIIFLGDKEFCNIIDNNKLGYSLSINNINNINNTEELLKKINNYSSEDKSLFSESTHKYFKEHFDLKNIVNKFCRDVLDD